MEIIRRSFNWRMENERSRPGPLHPFKSVHHGREGGRGQDATISQSRGELNVPLSMLNVGGR